MSEFRNDSRYTDTTFSIPLSMCMMVGLQLYLSNFVYKILIQESPDWFIAIIMSSIILGFGMPVSLSGIWQYINEFHDILIMRNKANWIIATIAYILLSAFGYFVLSKFQEEKTEGNPYIVYAICSIVVYSIGLWRTIKMFDNRMKIVESEKYSVFEYVYHNIEKIESGESTYGAVYQMISDQLYKDFYKEFAMKILRDKYISLNNEEIINDFYKFIIHKDKSGSKINVSTIYFPTSHYHPSMKKKDRRTKESKDK